MAKITVIDQQIPNLEQPWAGVYEDGKQWGYDKARVEEFIKEQLKGKYGYINLRKNEAENMYYIECFASEDDFNEFSGDMEGNASLRLQNIQIPISTILGDSYSARLGTSIPVTSEIVSTEESLMVPLRFSGVRNSGGEQENFGAKGTLTIRRKVGSGEWITALVINDALTSFSASETSSYDYIDIRPALLKDVTQEIQARASYDYEDTDGSVKTAYSGWVNIGKSITETKLQLTLRTDYSKPISLTDANGTPQNFKVMYNTMGAVSKTLKFKIRGSVDEYAKDTIVPANQATAEACSINLKTDNYGLASHGIKYAEAWLETNDGMGNTIKSNTVRSQLMVASDNSNTNPYLLLQNIATSAINYMQSTICEYAIYSPTDEEIKIAMLLTDYTRDYEEERPVEYFRIEQEVVPNVKNTFVATIEIETESQDDSYAHLRIRRFDGDTETDFIKESTGDTYSYIITVDNRNAFTPVAGATFLLNPKVRSNNEENPARIINSRDDNKEVDSVWEGFGFITDGWIESSGQRILRVPAGGRLTIKRNLWRQFRSNPNSTLNFEIDFAVHNITNTTDPIIDIAEDTSGSYRGVRMNATDGWIQTKSYNNANNCLFSWQEDERTHLFFNINNMVSPQGPDVTYNGDINNIVPIGGSTPITYISLARVFMNGEVIREIPFNTSSADAKDEWGDNGCDIVIGNDGCDIDIYSIRAYENGSDDGRITAQSILMRNYTSTLTSIEEKQKIYERNSIVDGAGRITLEAAKALGLNCMVWHGVLPSQNNKSEYKGWYEYFRYDENRELMKEYSGTNCKASGLDDTITASDGPLTGKGQGSTAKTYWDWNIQDDNSKVETTIRVAIGDFHESIHVSEPYEDEGKTYVNIYGGNLGSDYPVGNGTNPYEYDNGYVIVPDGWIDGNGKYRGMGYMVSPDTALAQKKVIKINYASSMQSHLLGACKTYDLLHRAVVGDTPLQKHVSTAVSAKHTEPFLLFHEVNGNVYFKGMGNYGAAKMDDVAWGYNGDVHPNFALIEGSDNNLTLTDFRVPFDKNTVVYNCGEKYWEYNNLGNFDFDGGKTVKLTAKKEGDDCIQAQMADGWKFKGENVSGAKAPTANIRDRWAFVCNYIYLHGTNIKAYTKGGYSDFINEFNTMDDKAKAEWRDSKLWFIETDGDYKAYHLYRFDTLTQQWINAGLLGSNGQYKEINLAKDSITASAYNVNLGDYEKMNEAFKSAYALHMNYTIKYVMNERSLLFNYCYVLMFLTGSDNSSKNTYYKIMPYAESEEYNESFNAWYRDAFSSNADFDFENIYKVYLDGDDMDSIFRTDNNSHQTKPYYIERMYPTADEDPTKNLYQGLKNQLFNYVEERAKTDSKVLPDMMNEILTEAEGLVGDKDLLYGNPSNKKSAWGFLHKYFFNVQYYFPQVCYNEQARIRYEFPEMLGFVSTGDGARQIRPISQSLGSQLQNELQYMKQRLVYMASFGHWSSVGGGGGTLGITGTEPSTMSFLGDGSQYKFTLKSHQYIYPAFNIGTSSTHTGHRLRPGESFEYTIIPGADLGDTGIGLYAIDYYTSIGNVGDFNVKRESDFSLIGKRLREFIAEPTGSVAPFAPNSINVKATQLDVLSLKGCTGIEGALDLSALTRVQTIDLTGTKLYEVGIPYSANLTSIKLGNSIRRFVLNNTPNLSSVAFGAVDKIDTVIIGENVGTFDTKTFISALYSITAQLKQLSLSGVEWTIPIAFMMWLTAIENATVKGTITIEEPTTTPAVTFEYKNLINQKWGDVDHADSDEHRGLLLSYKQQAVGTATIMGNYYNEQTEHPFTLAPQSKYDNKFTKIEWNAVADGLALSEFSIDPVTGVLTTGELSKVSTKVIITATIYYGDEVVTSPSRTIEIYDRPAQIGDVVYYDGTYSSLDDMDYAEKTPVGICFYVAPRNADGSINAEYHDPRDKQTRLMVALTPITMPSYSSVAWGIYDSTDANYGIYATVGGTKVKCRTVTNSLNTTTLYDIPTIINIGSSGISGNISDANLRDENNVANDGFKAMAASVAAGDGFGYSETDKEKNYRILGNTADANFSNLAILAGDGYNEGDMVNSGYAKTLKIIEHRNKVLMDGLTADGLSSPLYASKEVPRATDVRTEMQSLASLLDSVKSWAQNTIGETATNAINKWMQLYYPAVSMAYAYEPEVNKATGETLADRFKSHNWFLPTFGQLARIYWLGKVDKDEHKMSSAITKGVLSLPSGYTWSGTESSATHAWYVLFSNGGGSSSGKTSPNGVVAVAAF